MGVTIPLTTPAIETVTLEDVESTPEGQAYLVPMKHEALLALMAGLGLTVVDVLRIEVVDEGRTLVLVETARLGASR